MAKVRSVLKDLSVEVAERKRICHRNRTKHVISKGDPCLVIRNADGMGSKNYCKLCAASIIDTARGDLEILEDELG